MFGFTQDRKKVLNYHSQGASRNINSKNNDDNDNTKRQKFKNINLHKIKDRQTDYLLSEPNKMTN